MFMFMFMCVMLLCKKRGGVEYVCHMCVCMCACAAYVSINCPFFSYWIFLCRSLLRSMPMLAREREDFGGGEAEAAGGGRGAGEEKNNRLLFLLPLHVCTCANLTHAPLHLRPCRLRRYRYYASLPSTAKAAIAS
jgi:hypothetical protein